MKVTVPPLDKEAEKRLLRVLAEVALEVGREEACDDKESRHTLAVGREEACDDKDGRHTLAVGREEACDEKESRRVLPCIDSIK